MDRDVVNDEEDERTPVAEARRWVVTRDEGVVTVGWSSMILIRIQSYAYSQRQQQQQ